MKLITISLVLVSFSFSRTCGKSLENVHDNDLVQLIKGEDNVVVLFTKNNCDKCDKFETAVENLQEDLQETVQATVVKAHNSNMVGIYDPSKEPSLIYFRRGIPLLYHGELNEDEILQTFSDNREPVVKELSDANFEHLTQSSTGATTGDWFVFFYSSDCIICQRLYAVWEAVGASLKRRLNVARVNRLQGGISTAKRFSVNVSPEFLFIRQGKFYRYKSDDYTPKSFVEFAQSVHLRNIKPETVQPISNQLNEFLTSNLQFLLDNPQILTFGAAGLVLTAITALCIKTFSTKKKPANNKSKKAK